MSQGTVYVTGVPDGFANDDHSPPPRLEIYELMKDDRQWSLYVQALSESSLAIFAYGFLQCTRRHAGCPGAAH
jgi:hypothetical protein